MEGMSLSWLGPEKQMFSKFNNLQYILDTLECTGRDCDSDFFDVASMCVRQFQATDIHSSVDQTATEGIAILNQTSYHTCPVSMLDCMVKSYYKLVNPLVERVFDDTGFKNLKKNYNCLYPSEEYDIQPSRFYLESKQVFVNPL